MLLQHYTSRLSCAELCVMCAPGGVRLQGSGVLYRGRLTAESLLD
jgi:hypothetical protein